MIVKFLNFIAITITYISFSRFFLYTITSFILWFNESVMLLIVRKFLREYHGSKISQHIMQFGLKIKSQHHTHPLVSNILYIYVL